MIVPRTMPASAGRLTASCIARFHLPLVLNAWLMTLVGPVLNFALARSALPQAQLAAFWLAFSVLLLAQSACMVLQPSSAAALRHALGLRAVAHTAVLLGAIASGIVLAASLTPFGDALFTALLPAAPGTARLTRMALLVMAPIPLLVALRGVAAGIAVVERRTEVLAGATGVRIAVLAATVAVVAGLHAGLDAVGAARALLMGTAAEALFLCGAMLAHGRAQQERPAGDTGGSAMLPVLRLVAPLAAASLVWCAIRPLVGAVLGRLADPELAQAGFGVVLPILMVSCAPLWGFLEVTLVLPQNGADARALIRYAALTSLGYAGVLAAVAWSPLRTLVLQQTFALTPELQRVVTPALGLLVLEPLVLSARAIAQGLLLRAGRGSQLLALSPVKLAAMALAGSAIVQAMPHANGAVLALGLIVGGDTVDAMLYGGAVWRSRALTMVGSSVPAQSEPDYMQEAA